MQVGHPEGRNALDAQDQPLVKPNEQGAEIPRQGTAGSPGQPIRVEQGEIGDEDQEGGVPSPDLESQPGVVAPEDAQGKNQAQNKDAGDKRFPDGAVEPEQASIQNPRQRQ